MKRSKVQQVFQALPYDWSAFTLLHFINFVQQQRQRPLSVTPVPHMAIPGICVRTLTDDYIFFDASDHPISQKHHILHEIGHFLLDHLQTIHQAKIDQDLPDIAIYLSKFRAYYFKSGADAEEEYEAEYFAYLVENQLAQVRRLQELTQRHESDDWHIPPFYGRFSKGADS